MSFLAFLLGAINIMASSSYDSAEYSIHKVFNITTAAGANEVQSSKFVAYADLLLQQVQATVVTAGTSVDNSVIISRITANGTDTSVLSAVVLSTQTSNETNCKLIEDGLLSQGDLVTFTNGADATGVTALVMTYHVRPSAST